MKSSDISSEAVKMLKYIKANRVDETALHSKFGQTAHVALNELETNYLVGYEFEADGTTHVIVPTDEGIYTLKNTSAERKELFLRSLWLPILVSFLTTLTVHGLQWLLPRLTEWFASFVG